MVGRYKILLAPHNNTAVVLDEIKYGVRIVESIRKFNRFRGRKKKRMDKKENISEDLLNYIYI